MKKRSVQGGDGVCNLRCEGFSLIKASTKRLWLLKKLLLICSFIRLFGTSVRLHTQTHLSVTLYHSEEDNDNLCTTSKREQNQPHIVFVTNIKHIQYIEPDVHENCLSWEDLIEILHSCSHYNQLEQSVLFISVLFLPSSCRRFETTEDLLPWLMREKQISVPAVKQTVTQH